jgi:hypothetical protein
MSLNFASDIVSAFLTSNILTDNAYQTPGTFNIPEGSGADQVLSITVGGTNNNLTSPPTVSLAAPATFNMTGTTVIGTTTLSNLSFTVALSATATNGSNILTSIVSTAQLSVGMAISSGNGVPSGASILQVMNSTSVVMSANATSTATASHNFTGGSSSYLLIPGMTVSDGAVNITASTTILSILSKNSVQMSNVALATDATPFSITVGGINAAAYAVLTPTSIGSIASIASAGSGYTGLASAYPILFGTDSFGHGSGATGVASHFEVVNPLVSEVVGANTTWITGDLIAIIATAGTTQTTQAVLYVTAAAGIITSLATVGTGASPGSYTRVDVIGTTYTVSVTSIAGTATGFIPTFGVLSATLSTGGTGFAGLPPATIPVSGGTAAVLTLTLTATSVANFVVTTPGSLYTSSVPAVTMGSGNATGTAVLGSSKTSRMLTMIEIMRAFFAGSGSADEAKLEYYVLKKMLSSYETVNRGSFSTTTYNANIGAADGQIVGMNHYVIQSQNLNSFTADGYVDYGRSKSGASDI